MSNYRNDKYWLKTPKYLQDSRKRSQSSSGHYQYYDDDFYGDDLDYYQDSSDRYRESRERYQSSRAYNSAVRSSGRSRKKSQAKTLKWVLITVAVLAVAILGATIAVNRFYHPSYDLDKVPAFSDESSVRIDHNKPAFTENKIEKAQKNLKNWKKKAAAIKKSSKKKSGKGKKKSAKARSAAFLEKKLRKYEKFAELDSLGRCGRAQALVGKETMPEGKRGPIGKIKPSGWKVKKYDFIDNGGYLFNRCHLVGWLLTGRNAEKRNLITGTRYLNNEGMLPYEKEVADYVRESGNHVLYRVTPIFKGKELVARGVQIEAMSVEDDGKGVSFNVYCYNAQPGVDINYKNGKSKATKDADKSDKSDK